MGNTRYTKDEEEFAVESFDNRGGTFRSCFDRNSALSGYVKLIILLVAVVLIFSFRAYLIDRVVVRGQSMNPTLTNGNVIWCQKYNLSDIKRNDIVVANIEGQLVIKRVIGIPTDTVKITDGFVSVFDKSGGLIEKESMENFQSDNHEILLDEEEYFLMGDNREHSFDSRAWGAVNISKIKGIAIVRFFPFWDIKTLR